MVNNLNIKISKFTSAIIICLIFVFRLITLTYFDLPTHLPLFQTISIEATISLLLIVLTKLTYQSTTSIFFLITTPFYFMPYRWEQKIIVLIFLLAYLFFKSSTKLINAIVMSALSILILLYLKRPIITFQYQLEILNGINHLRGNNIDIFGSFLSRFLFNKINLFMSIYKYILEGLSNSLWFNTQDNLNQISPLSFLYIPLIISGLRSNSLPENNLKHFFYISLIIISLSGSITKTTSLTFLFLPVFNFLIISLKKLSKQTKTIFLLASFCYSLFTYIYFL